jgi:hypothetical protein
MIDVTTIMNKRYTTRYKITTRNSKSCKIQKIQKIINHVLVCAGIKEIQSMKIINTSSQACPNSTYSIGLLINGNHNTQDPTR